MESPFVPPDLCNWSQLIFLSFVYAYVLCEGSNLISDGSELLLLVPSLAGLIGSIVLPVLGAVPDGMMVLFSGLGDPATVDKQIGVGIGTMAGSTVMLLTMSWFLAIYGGRVNITKSGRCTYHPPDNAPEGWEKLFPPENTSLTRTGVKVKSSIRENAYYMLITGFGFVVVQIGSYANMVYPGAQQIFYWIGLAWGFGGFVVYLKAMYDSADSDESQQQRIVEAIH
jgi:hypothetical protein